MLTLIKPTPQRLKDFGAIRINKIKNYYSFTLKKTHYILMGKYLFYNFSKNNKLYQINPKINPFEFLKNPKLESYKLNYAPIIKSIEKNPDFKIIKTNEDKVSVLFKNQKMLITILKYSIISFTINELVVMEL